MEGPEAAYVQSDLYSDVMSNHPPNQFAAGSVNLENQPLDYKSYTKTHPKSIEQQEKEAKISANIDQLPHGKQLYIGNLTWWTNDEELSNAITECGVTDLISVKFFENRVNAQSKGFALVEVASDTSQRLVSERLPGHVLHGQKPMVMEVNKQNLAMFEQQARKDKPATGGWHGGEEDNRGGGGGGSGGDGYRGEREARRERDDRNRRGGRDERNDRRAPQQALPQGLAGGLAGATGMIPQMIDPNTFAAHLQQFQQPQIPGGFPPGSIIVDALGNIIQGPLPPGLIPGGPPPGYLSHGGVPPQFMPRPGVAPPGHVNPAFMQPPPGAPVDPVTGVPLQTGAMNEQDLESMRRNQAVASTAIQRAMTDANQGEFESGIETLVTAISLIKQSTTANSDPAKVLIQSLQDCLHGLESQLVQRGPRERKRSSERDDRRRDSRSGRDRSGDRRYSSRRGRSRERSPRERGDRGDRGGDRNERGDKDDRDRRGGGDAERGGGSEVKKERGRAGRKSYSLSPVRGPIIPAELPGDNNDGGGRR